MVGNRSQYQFVLEYVASKSFGTDEQGNHRSALLETTCSYDNGLDFVAAFGKKFPGRKPDPNLINAQRRLSALCKWLYDYGWLDRGRQSNSDLATRDEPKWQYVYSLPTSVVTAIKTGKRTAWDFANVIEDGDVGPSFWNDQ